MRTLTLVAAVLVSASPAIAMDMQEVGLSGKGVPIRAAVVRGSSESAPVVALVGGLAGEDASSRAVLQAVETFDKQPQSGRRYTLIGIAVANPDASRLIFPPVGVAYRDNAESHALWRWLAIHAPDLALVVGPDESGLVQALSETTVSGIGRVPARHMTAAARLLDAVPATIAESEAHHEINGRRRRTPRQVADEKCQRQKQDRCREVVPAGMLGDAGGREQGKHDGDQEAERGDHGGLLRCLSDCGGNGR